MRYLSCFLLLCAMAFSLARCTPDDANEVPSSLRVQDFIWKGMNLYYLWQDEVADLTDDRFPGQRELNGFLSGYPDPIALFNHLRTDPQTDRFSVIYSDYRVLQAVLTGNNDNNGMDFALRYVPGSNTDVFGWVRYVLPNSDAEAKNVQRGQIFYAVNGTPLTVSNYRELLAPQTYTIQLADFNNDNIVPNGQSITLTKSPYSENPIYRNLVVEQGAHKIGYLMYNGFYRGYEPQLNAAMASLQAAGITDLVLDLRYNSGGSIDTATRLASMITGQFTGQIFAREQWNPKVQAYYENTQPNSLIDRFTDQLAHGSPLTQLNLSRVYVLTTGSTASASELVINGLAPYIDVIQIGETTTGKNVGSITLYDSPTFRAEDRNTSHRYAMQPIVLRIANRDQFGDYTQGLPPDVPFQENLENPGILGDTSEPLLATAINLITGSGRMSTAQPATSVPFTDSKALLNQDQMYKESDALPSVN